jgi:hypothetical protein
MKSQISFKIRPKGEIIKVKESLYKKRVTNFLAMINLEVI